MYKAMEQIEKDYDGQWVYMVNCTKKESGRLLGGDVVLAGKTQAEIYRKKLNTTKDEGLTFIGYVGKVPEGVAFL